MHIRPATPDDAAALQQLAHSAGKLDAHSIAVLPAAEKLTLVAADESLNVIGFLVAHYDLEQKTARIESVYATDEAVTHELGKNAEAALANMGCALTGTPPVTASVADPATAGDTPVAAWVEESIRDDFTAIADSDAA